MGGFDPLVSTQYSDLAILSLFPSTRGSFFFNSKEIYPTRSPQKDPAIINSKTESIPCLTQSSIESSSGMHIT